jgi:hypothetical protein
MVAAVRLQSGLRNNPLFSDGQIASLVDKAWKEMYDLFVQSFAHWFSKSYSFTLTGGTPELSRLDIETLVPDLQMVQGVNWLPAANQIVPMDELPSFAERGSYGAYNGVFGYSGGAGRTYFPNGDYLEVWPYQTSAGNYQLLYTPEAETLALPTTVSWTLNASTNVQDNAGTNVYNFASAAGAHPPFVDAMLGGALTVSFMEPNADWDAHGDTILGPVPISAGNSMETNVLWPGGSFTNPSVGTASITYQAAGTRDDLPNTVRQWSLFIETHASIAIRQSRRQPCQDLEQKLQQERLRIVTNAKQRAEGVTQAPITRARRGWGGYYGY